jgi:SAM-dependent methyltransferase
VEGYRPSTYGDRFADVYDDWYSEVSDVAATVERVTALAERHGRRVLELGAGSGRLAVPLAQRGLDVWAVDASPAMLDRLRAKPGAHAVHAVLDDMASLAAAELPPDGEYGVVLCAFNTLFNLTDTPTQRRCLTRVAALLGPDGRFVVEAFVPPPSDTDTSDTDTSDTDTSDTDTSEGGVGIGRTVSAVEPRHIGLDDLVLTVSRLDPDSRTIVGQHVHITEAGIRLRPWMLHFQSPAGLDALAAEAGLRLVERHGGWRGEPFTSSSSVHVSVYRPAHGRAPSPAPADPPDPAG